MNNTLQIVQSHSEVMLHQVTPLSAPYVCGLLSEYIYSLIVYNVSIYMVFCSSWPLFLSIFLSTAVPRSVFTLVHHGTSL